MRTALTTQYRELHKEIRAVLHHEPSCVARYATVSAMLAHAFTPRFFWTGFYLVDPEKTDELVVGPYQGTLGCLRIRFGAGVCGVAAQKRETIIVPDVEAFPGHIACDARSRSEIVVPVFAPNGVLAGVLDVDSMRLNAFGPEDAVGLEAICADLLKD